MKGLTLRGLKIYFRDKGGVFFSLLGVLIIFALFIFFIGDSIIEDLDWLDNSKSIMNAWVVAGMLASASITTSMGAYAQMVTDRDQKIIKDFYTSPISRASITASYMLTGFIVSVIMSVIVLMSVIVIVSVIVSVPMLMAVPVLVFMIRHTGTLVQDHIKIAGIDAALACSANPDLISIHM